MAAFPAEPALPSIIAGLAQPPPARIRFTEVRFLHVLDRPLLVSGEMAWLGQDHLQRKVLQPSLEQVDIDGEQVTLQRQGRAPRHFSLRHAPPLQLLLQSFSGLLSGDLERLQPSFELSLQTRGSSAWTLDLRPRDEAMRQQILHIAIDGQGRQLRCMRIEEAHGDHSVELFGPLATQLPATLQTEALQRLCQGTD